MGIDVILDKNLKPWFLEMNARPSLSINHELECGTNDLKNGILVSEVDLKIKEPVMYDAIMLASMRANKY